jgi:hypothetical protein
MNHKDAEARETIENNERKLEPGTDLISCSMNLKRSLCYTSLLLLFNSILLICFFLVVFRLQLPDIASRKLDCMGNKSGS